MIGECVLLAICLRLLLQLQGRLLSMMAPVVTLDIGKALGSMTAYLGAGVYEELLFRLLLLPLLAWVLRRFRIAPAASMAGAVLLSSLLFAAAHYIGPYGDDFNNFASFSRTFFFRTLAGMFFAVLFVYRGFGIAAGTHAGYDLLVGLAELGIGGV
jgi:membrane protease YdiL (CAAX protease family)